MTTRVTAASAALVLLIGLPLAGTALAQTALPTGDPAKGEQVFKQCAVCHTIGPNAGIRIGPPLNGIVGRPWASWPGYSYSPKLAAGKAAGKVWDEATLNDWLTAPMTFLPGTKMTFAGLHDPQQRADVIAYLKQFDAKGEKH